MLLSIAVDLFARLYVACFSATRAGFCSKEVAIYLLSDCIIVGQFEYAGFFTKDKILQYV